MQGFLNIILSLPTLIFTVMLGVLFVYWFFMILGAVDLDLFDLDVDVDADIDVDVDVDVDVDADVDADVSVDGGPGGVLGIVASVLSALGLIGIPVTITLSVFTLASWAFSFLGAYALGGAEIALTPLIGTGVGLGAMAIATPLTSLLLRPLRSVFVTTRGFRGADAVIGHSVKVTSGKVTPGFGRASTTIDGAHQEFSIRCEDPDNGLTKGDEALVIGYDADKHVYLVEPMGSMLADPEATGVSLSDAFQELEESQEAAAKAK